VAQRSPERFQPRLGHLCRDLLITDQEPQKTLKELQRQHQEQVERGVVSIPA
jgi:hypothetical protein